MAIIDPDGLFNGDRFRKCSNQARLYWPYFFLASNGYGRIEVNYHRIIGRAFSTFNPVPTESDVMHFIREYQGAYLLFLYEFDGAMWGQWDCPDKFLNKYKTAFDKSSPNPPEDLYKKWQNEYVVEKSKTCNVPETFQKLFDNTPKTFPQNLPLGVGVVVGDVVGDDPPKDLHATNYASMLCDEFGITQTPQARQAVIGTVEAAAVFYEIDHYNAYEKLKAAAQSAASAGILVNHWWFSDGKWKPSTKPNSPKPLSPSERVKLDMQADRIEKEQARAARVQ